MRGAGDGLAGKVQVRLTEHQPGLNVPDVKCTPEGEHMTLTALMIFVLISQILVAGYLLYSFNDVSVMCSPSGVH